MKTAHHGRQPLGYELQREVAAARILIRLHAREPDEQFDAVFASLFLDCGNSLGRNRAVADFVP